MEWLRYSLIPDATFVGDFALCPNGDIVTAQSVDFAGVANTIILNKYRPDGALLWSVNFGLGDNSRIGSVIVDQKDGSIFVVGSSLNGNQGQSGQADSDLFVVSCSPLGLLNWRQYFGSQFHETAPTAVFDAQANLLISAQIEPLSQEQAASVGSVDFYGSSYTGGSNSFQLKIQRDNGTVVRSSLTGSNRSGSKSLSRSSSKDISLVHGFTYEAFNGYALLGKDKAALPNHFIVARNDSTASLLWTRIELPLCSNIVAQDVDQSAYFVASGGILHKVDLLSGRTLWSRTLADRDYVLHPLAQGGVLVCHRTNDGPIVLFRVDHTGNSFDQFEIPQSGQTIVRRILEDARGSLFILGSTTGRFPSLSSQQILAAPTGGGLNAFLLVSRSRFSAWRSRTNEGASTYVVESPSDQFISLQARQLTTDPDGDKAAKPTFLWESSRNGATWSPRSKLQSFRLSPADQGLQFRAVVTYQDDDGYDEIVTTSPLSIPFRNEGQASFLIRGRRTIGESLSVVTQAEDPDGPGVLSCEWQQRSDDGTWLTVQTGPVLPLFEIHLGKMLRARLSYRDANGFDEVVLTQSLWIPQINTGKARFRIDGQPYVGSLLKAVVDARDPDGQSSINYQWSKKRPRDSLWKPFSSRASYLLRPADYGQLIRLDIQYTDKKNFKEAIEPLLVPPIKAAGDDMLISLTPPRQVFFEGEVLVFIIKARQDQIGSKLFWRLSGQVAPSDFSGSALSGVHTVGDNTTFSLSFPTSRDRLVESPEKLAFTLYDDPMHRSPIATSRFAVLYDPPAANFPVSLSADNGLLVDHHLFGTTGADRLVPLSSQSGFSWAIWGDAGRDVLAGDAHDDVLAGGAGHDVLTGGLGRDTFVFSSDGLDAPDLLTDFSPQQDRIALSVSLMPALRSDRATILRWSDVSTQERANRFFNANPAQHYVLVDHSAAIKRVSALALPRKVCLTVNLDRRCVFFDLNTRELGSGPVLFEFPTSQRFALTPDNFIFGVENI